FTYNCGKFTPLRLQRWEYQNYENYLAICYPSGPGLHQFRGGGDFFVASHDELRQISDVANCNT
ncbi:hypothetical protein U9265_25415, partial [Escherichia coli]